MKLPSYIKSIEQQLNDPYCFRFTWLGSKFNANSTYLDATCDDVTRGADVPCIPPLVATGDYLINLQKELHHMSGNFVSENSRIPNVTFMWYNDTSTRSNISCRMTPENVCVKYSYYYNNARKHENDIQ